MTTTAQAPRAALPPINLSTVATVLFAGAAATIVFDLFGQTVSPLLKSIASPLLGSKLAPVPLAQQVLQQVTGLPGDRLAALGLPHGLHILTGLVAYPLGWLLIARPIWQATLPRLPWLVPAIAYGVALWVFALYFMAHLVAGNPPFLAFTGIIWVALWGHILFALVAALIIERRLP